MVYISVFGQWKPSMQTLSFVMVAAPISFLLGLVFGIWAYRNKWVEATLNPVLNVMQTMPHYAYLVPIMVLFGIGDHAGAIATIIFATPPMVRLTLLGLRKVSPEVIEAGKMSGCNELQHLFKVLIPTARHDILIGVNQVIMQCLAMAVIASFIGAKGLGWNLLLALNQLRIGLALEAGVNCRCFAANESYISQDASCCDFCSGHGCWLHNWRHTVSTCSWRIYTVYCFKPMVG